MRAAASSGIDRKLAHRARETMNSTSQPVRQGFDHAASTYDHDFTDSLIGRLQRVAGWQCLDRVFSPGERVLDLGCGTGADAIHLAQRELRVHAVDVSPRMIAVAQPKIAAADLAGSITTAVAAIEDLNPDQLCTESTATTCLPFDGVISNFGALNCVRDLRVVASTLGDVVRPGGHIAICLISRFCLWETIYYALRGRFDKAGRRWKDRAWKDHGAAPASVGGSAEFTIYYRSVREIAEAFGPELRLRHHSGIGLFVPPSYVRSRLPGWNEFLKICAGFDRVFSAWPVLRGMADHVLLIFTREPQP